MIESPKAKNYENKARSPEWEGDLLVWLREQEEEEEARFNFLLELVQYQPLVALQLAHKSLESRSSFVKLLEHGVKTCDASSIKHWLECVVPRIGFRRTSENLLKLSASEPEGVSKAFYWLPRFATSESDKLKLESLEKTLAEKGIIQD